MKLNEKQVTVLLCAVVFACMVIALFWIWMRRRPTVVWRVDRNEAKVI